MTTPGLPSALPADLAAVQADDALIDTLRLIDRSGCSTFTSGRCLDPDSGRTRGAEYGADAWCKPCVAADALNGLTCRPEGDPTSQALLAWRREIESEPMPRLMDTDTALALIRPHSEPRRFRRLAVGLRTALRGARRRGSREG